MLGFPAEWDCVANAFGHRVVEVGFGCMGVCIWPKCVFILPWPVSGLGGRFSFGRPEPVCYSVCVCLCVCVCLAEWHLYCVCKG